ncbi:general stress protein [Microbacterium testaceum]|uniref:general stress protein n=1 Tax=Microbacterium testaceum TaxID=2033 RepID=UPI001CD9E92E|nr:general stress protein [Microbacterium testaceum]
MSMFAQRPGAGRDEVGEKIASFPTYEQAQKAVSSLIAGEVPARDIAIVGSGLRSIERITGKLGYATAARSGALNGLMLGLLFAFIFVLGMPTVQISAFIGVLLVGMALGMILSIGTYSIVRRRRDFASVMQVAADHYDVCVAAPSVHKARGIVGPAGAGRTVVSRPAATDTAPPQYGERIAPGAGAPHGAPPRPPAPTPGPRDDEPPRYGERIAPQAPVTEPGSGSDVGSGSGSDAASGSGSSSGSRGAGAPGVAEPSAGEPGAEAPGERQDPAAAPGTGGSTPTDPPHPTER